MIVLVAAATLYATLITAGAWVAVACLRRAPASLRQLVWWCGVVAPAACTLVLGLLTPFLRPYRVLLRMEPVVVIPSSARAGVIVSAIWLAGVAALLLWAAAGTIAVRRRARRTAATAASPEWRALVDAIAAAAGIRRRVRLRIGGTAVPFTYGVLRPVVVLPASAWQWSDTRVRFVLLHELAHVARYDAVARAVERVAAALFWFHPLVWLAIRKSRQERECACDDVVIDASGHPADYARELLDLSLESGVAPRAALGLTSTAIEWRIVALCDRARSRAPARAAHVLAALVTVGCAASGALLFGAGPVAGVDLCAAGAEPSLPTGSPDAAGARIRRFARCTELVMRKTCVTGDGVSVAIQSVDVRGTRRMLISGGVRTYSVDGVPAPAESGAAWLEEMRRLYDENSTAAPEIRAAVEAASRPRTRR